VGGRRGHPAVRRPRVCRCPDAVQVGRGHAVGATLGRATASGRRLAELATLVGRARARGARVQPGPPSTPLASAGRRASLREDQRRQGIAAMPVRATCGSAGSVRAIDELAACRGDGGTDLTRECRIRRGGATRGCETPGAPRRVLGERGRGSGRCPSAPRRRARRWSGCGGPPRRRWRRRSVRRAAAPVCRRAGSCSRRRRAAAVRCTLLRSRS
jgi:hypothetical protein